MDHDTVESSNLQRQILHTEERLGVPKAASAATAIKGCGHFTVRYAWCANTFEKNKLECEG